MTNCEICNKSISHDDVFMVNRKQIVCLECAEMLARQAKIENREINIICGVHEEPQRLCENCYELMPEEELQQEIDYGYLCDRCVAAINSHGVDLQLNY